MTSALELLYSWPFALGALAGIALDRLYKCWRAHWLNMHKPLPDGQKYHAGGYHLVYVAAVVAVAVLGYVLLTVNRTEQHYEHLAGELAACQTINAQNDDLSIRMRALFLERNEAETQWLNRVVAPDNPEIAALDPQDPRRKDWVTDATIVYNERADRINAQIRAISEQQIDLAEQRNANPTCNPAEEPDG